MPRGFGGDGGAADLFRQAKWSRGDEGGPARWRQSVETVHANDLRALGIPLDPSVGARDFGGGGIDPDDYTFQAALAALKARQNPGDEMAANRAEKLKQQAEMIKIGRDEVLRQRQKGFNDITRQQQANPRIQYDPYGDKIDPLITSGTGAAVASHALAGRGYELPDATRDVSMYQKELALDRAQAANEQVYGNRAAQAQIDASNKANRGYMDQLAEQQSAHAMQGLQRARRAGGVTSIYGGFGR